MIALIKLVSILTGIFTGASLLSGSSIAFTTWYSFPKELSDFIIILLTLTSLVYTINKSLLYILIRLK